jgi:hypothetical protein
MYERIPPKCSDICLYNCVWVTTRLSLYWRATVGFQLEKGDLVSREINYCIIVSCLLNFSNFLHAQVYHSIWCKTHYDVTDENNNISSDGLDRYYHKYPSSSYQTHRDISDNVCLDLQNCCCSYMFEFP